MNLARRLTRFGIVVIEFVTLSLLASWLQACIFAVADPKGLIEIDWGFSPSFGGWHKNIGWRVERSNHEVYMAIVTEIENDRRRDWYKETGELIEETEAADDGEDACARWVQENILSFIDKRFVKKTQQQRLQIWEHGIQMPMAAEWYGFPFDGWEVRFDEYKPTNASTPIAVLFGIDTKLSRLPFSWWRPPYQNGTRFIPNRILPVVPRIPQALANGVLTLAAGWGVWRLFKRLRADRRELRGRCGHCGYPRSIGNQSTAAAAVETTATITTAAAPLPHALTPCSECGTPRRSVRVLW